jgi:hypothetical protein
MPARIANCSGWKWNITYVASREHEWKLSNLSAFSTRFRDND